MIPIRKGMQMPRLFKTAASLRIFGDDLDPEEITAQLGKRPDKAEKKGETIHNPSGTTRIARRGRWSITVERQKPGDLDAQIKTLLAEATDNAEVWQSITSRFDADVFCGLFMDEENEGLEISPDALNALGTRGIRMNESRP